MDLDRNAARSVREAFLDAGFTADGLLVALGPSAYAALGRGEPVPAQRALADRQDPLAALARLFVLGAEIPREDAARALPLAELVELGLVTASGAVRARVDVRPYGESDTDWYVVSDHGPDSAGHDVEEVAVDHVLGVGGASLTLARITPRATVARALDLGTGCGVQALHLGRHATEVVATDRNRRALRLAAVSAALSGQEWDLREGSLFEPVAGEAFDLVVSNPPFVISPGHRYTYRDAGLPADDRGRPTGCTSTVRTGAIAWLRGSRRPGATRGWLSARCRIRRSTSGSGCATPVGSRATRRLGPSTSSATPSGSMHCAR